MQSTKDYAAVIMFHGHECPGAAFGMRVAQAALARLGHDSPDNPIIAQSETDACAIDAIQALTGCTYGKRNLVHKDNGRNVFTFWQRGSESGLRVRAVPGSVVYRTDELWRLADLIDAGEATAEEAKRFALLQEERIHRILDAPDDELMIIDEVPVTAPERRRVAPMAPCEECGELTSEETLHDHRGRMLCPPCHLDAHDGTLPANHADHGHVQHHHHTH
jgi:formylmethanofuran dehydrogenase subunit E